MNGKPLKVTGVFYSLVGIGLLVFMLVTKREDFSMSDPTKVQMFTDSISVFLIVVGGSLYSLGQALTPKKGNENA